MKHLKETFILLLVMMLVIGCNIDGESNYTPTIGVLNPATINTDSILHMKHNEEGNVIFDSLHLNDTILIYVQAKSYSNFLTKFEYTISNESAIKVITSDTIQRYFDPNSDFTHNKFKFPKHIIYMNYPFHFVAKEQSDALKIKFVIQSDAVEIKNENSIIMEFPIK